MKWKTEDGRQIDVKNMSTEHIKNALALLKRKGFIGKRVFINYMTYQPPKGEVAQRVFEAETDYIIKSKISEFVDIFEDELKRRISNGNE